MSRKWTFEDEQRLVTKRRLKEQNRQTEERRLSREREREACVKDVENSENKRFLMQMQQEQHDRQIQCSLQQAEEMKRKRDRQLEQDERMAKELARINHEKEKDEKMRQYIRANSLELKELESKLRYAYLNKERAAQMAEAEAIRMANMREEEALNLMMKNEYDRVTDEQLKLDQKRHKELLQYHEDLEQQLAEREQQRQDAYEEFLREKLLVDEIVRKIHEEEQREREIRLEKVKVTQQHIDEFKKQQAEWRRIEQEKMEEENKRIMEFATQQKEMQDTRKAEARAKEQAKDQLHKTLFEKIESERLAREELDRAREEFYLEAEAEASRQKDIKDMEKKIRERLALQQTFREQMAFKERVKQAAKEEEDDFRIRMMEKFAEDDRIEQMNNQKRRMKQIEHRRAVENLIEARRKQHEEDLQLEARERELEAEREEVRRQIIEEERQKLIKHHATKLMGFLPRGLLHENDMDVFVDDARKDIKCPTDPFSDNSKRGNY